MTDRVKLWVVISGHGRSSQHTGQPGHVLGLAGRRRGTKPYLRGHVGHLHTRHSARTHLGPGGVARDHGEGLGPLGGARVEERRTRVRDPGVKFIID